MEIYLWRSGSEDLTYTVETEGYFYHEAEMEGKAGTREKSSTLLRDSCDMREATNSFQTIETHP